MNRIILLLLFIPLISACKKDRLKGESEVLVGKWRWVKTIKSLDQPQNVFADPNTDGKTSEIEFFKRGILRYYENNNEVFCYKIRFNGSNDCDESHCFFWFESDENELIKIFSYVSFKDTIYVTDYLREFIQ